MKRLILTWSAILLTVLCTAPVRAQAHAWSMAAQLRVQLQWQRQAMMQERAFVQSQMRAVQQQLKVQKQIAHALKPRVPKQHSLPRIKHPSALATRSRTTAPKKSSLAKQVRASARTTRNGPSVQMRNARSTHYGRSRAGHLARPPALARNRTGTTLRRLLPKPGVMNIGRLSQPRMPGAPSSILPPSASVGSGTQPLPTTSQGVASGQTPGSTPPAPNPAQPPPPLAPPQGGQAGQAPVVLDAPQDPFSPLMHKATEARGDSKPTTPQSRIADEPTSFFADSISAPSDSAGKSSTQESAIMRLVSAIATGKDRPQAPTETAAIQPDLIRQTPSLPALQPRYPVFPLLAVD